MAKHIYYAFYIALLVFVMLFTACEASVHTVNQLLYPYLVVNSNGEIRVVSGAALKTIHIPDDIDLGNGSVATKFMGFENQEDAKVLTSVSFGEGITMIGDGAFASSSNLSSVTFEGESKLEHIGSSAFEGTSISSIDIPDSVKSIGNNAFKDASELSSVKLGSGLENIGSSAFENTSIKSLNVPSSVDKVGDNAFKGASSLTSVTISSGNTAIGSNTFSGTSITTLRIPAAITEKGSTCSSVFGSKVSSVTVTGGGSDGTSIGGSYFSGLDDLKSVGIGSGVKNIGSYAFSGCDSLSSISFPNGLETIGSGAFTNAGTSGITYTLPASVTDASGAFESDDTVFMTYEVYSNLTGSMLGSFTAQVSPAGKAEDNIYSDVQKLIGIGGNSGKFVSMITDQKNKEFYNDQELAFGSTGADTVIKPVIPGTNSSDPTAASNGGKFNVDIDNKYLEYKQNETSGSGASVGLVSGVRVNEEIDIPVKYRNENVTAIRDNAFNQNVQINLQDNNGITSVGKGAFEGNKSFTDFDKLDKVETIGDNAFKGATGIAKADESGLKTIEIPDSVKNVGTGAFTGTNAEKIVIPASNASDNRFNQGAFGPSSSLKEVVIEGHTSNEDGKSIAAAFGDNNTGVTKLTIPADLINTKEEIDALHKAFPNLKEIVITEPSGSLNSPCSGNLKDFSSLESLTVPADLLNGRTDGSGILDGNTSIKDLTIVKGSGNDEKSTTVPESAFNNLDSLTDVTIGEGITVIGSTSSSGSTADSGAFAGCDNLESITLPSTVTTIGDGTFENCGELDEIIQTNNKGEVISDPTYMLPNGVASIGDNAFSGTQIDFGKLPSSVTSVGDGAFAINGSNGNPAVSYPGIEVEIPAGIINNEHGLDDIFLPADKADGTKADRPAYFDKVTISGGKDFNTSHLTGDDDSDSTNPNAGVDVVIGSLVVDGSTTSVTIGDLSNVSVLDSSAGGNGTLEITLPEGIDNITINGPINGPKTVDSTGNVIGDGSISFEPNGTLPVGPEIAIGDNAFGSSYPAAGGTGVDPFWSVENPKTDTDGSEIVNVTSIGKEAFKDNTNITRITIPKECTSIDANAFAGCTNLREIIFEGPRDYPISIAPSAFDGCTNLSKISNLDTENNKYNEAGEGEALFIESSLQNFGDEIFKDSAINKVILPSDATNVSNNAFKDSATFEITFPVKGNMSVDSYPGEGQYPDDKNTDYSEDMTFKGSFGTSTEITASMGSDSTSGPEKYGYDGTLSIGNATAAVADGNTLKFTNGNLSISDLVGNKDSAAIEWEPKTFEIEFSTSFTGTNGKIETVTKTETVEFGTAPDFNTIFKDPVDGWAIKKGSGEISADDLKYFTDGKLTSVDIASDPNVKVDFKWEKLITVTINGETKEIREGSTLNSLGFKAPSDSNSRYANNTGSVLKPNEATSIDLNTPLTDGMNINVYHQVSINGNGGTVTNSTVYVKDNSNISSIANELVTDSGLNRDHFTFSSWSGASSVTGTATITANWNATVDGAVYKAVVNVGTYTNQTLNIMNLDNERFIVPDFIQGYTTNSFKPNDSVIEGQSSSYTLGGIGVINSSGNVNPGSIVTDKPTLDRIINYINTYDGSGKERFRSGSDDNPTYIRTSISAGWRLRGGGIGNPSTEVAESSGGNTTITDGDQGFFVPVFRF